MITREAIESTYERIRPFIRTTPVVEIAGDDLGLPGVALIVKLELLQHSGSFKARGAFANLLLREVPEAGVVAASGGNHGAAVAYAAQRLGIPAKIFVPTVSSPAKQQRIRGYGADLVVTGDRYADALAASEEWAHNPARCASTPTTSTKRSSARRRPGSSWRGNRATSTRCSSPSAAAD